MQNRSNRKPKFWFGSVQNLRPSLTKYLYIFFLSFKPHRPLKELVTSLEKTKVCINLCFFLCTGEPQEKKMTSIEDIKSLDMKT